VFVAGAIHFLLVFPHALRVQYIFWFSHMPSGSPMQVLDSEQRVFDDELNTYLKGHSVLVAGAQYICGVEKLSSRSF
jgi:hypothetical protein